MRRSRPPQGFARDLTPSIKQLGGDDQGRHAMAAAAGEALIASCARRSAAGAHPSGRQHRRGGQGHDAADRQRSDALEVLLEGAGSHRRREDHRRQLAARRASASTSSCSRAPWASPAPPRTSTATAATCARRWVAAPSQIQTQPLSELGRALRQRRAPGARHVPSVAVLGQGAQAELGRALLHADGTEPQRARPGGTAREARDPDAPA